MPTDAVERGSRSGFSLIEVMVALVLIAVGLMALQALSISTISTLSRADRNSKNVSLATHVLEDGLQQVRQGLLPQPCSDKLLAGGSRVTRTVTTAPTASGSAVNGLRVNIAVTVTSPAPNGSSYLVGGSSYAPVSSLGGGRACP